MENIVSIGYVGVMTSLPSLHIQLPSDPSPNSEFMREREPCSEPSLGHRF